MPEGLGCRGVIFNRKVSPMSGARERPLVPVQGSGQSGGLAGSCMWERASHRAPGGQEAGVAWGGLGRGSGKRGKGPRDHGDRRSW